jgi:hypothetical protein
VSRAAARAFRRRWPPPLVACERLSVVGDVVFGRDVTVRGSVKVEHDGPGQLRIDDGALLEGCLKSAQAG